MHQLAGRRVFLAITFFLLVPASARADAPIRVSLDLQRDQLDAGFSPWSQISLGIRREFSFGPILLRGTAARRFDQLGGGVELEGYPRISERSYLHWSAGAAGGDFFPKVRGHLEWYRSLGSGWEGSLGAEHRSYRTLAMNALTLSLARYLGGMLFTLRPTYSASSLGGAWSGRVQGRHYFSEESFFELGLGGGTILSQRGSPGDIVRLPTRSVSTRFRASLGPGLAGSLGASLSDEEIRPNVNRKDVALSVGVEKEF